MEANDIRDSRLLVRLYSFDAEGRNPPGSEAHALARVLTDGQGSRNAAIDPWRRFFEPQDQSEDKLVNGIVNTTLGVETAALGKKWLDFRDSCSDAERLDLSMSQPTMKGVVDTVQAIQKTWELRRQNGRLNKAKRLFHKFCDTLNSHTLMMTVLPSGSEYVSVFTGALNVIIHASANHEKVVEGLSDSLSTIGEYVSDCAIDQELFQTEDMQKLIADLYSHIFLFLTTVMDWMMKKRRRRLLDSFNEDLLTVFEDDMEKIKTITKRIRNLAEQGSRAEVRSARSTLEELARDVRVGLEGERRHQAEMRHHAEGIKRNQQRNANLWSFEKRQQLADSIVDLLEDRALGWLEKARGMHDMSRQPFLNPTVALSLVQPSIKATYTSEEVALNSRFLEDYFDRDRVRLPTDSFSPVMISPEILRNISEWAKAPAPNLLWLDGEPIKCDDFDNPITMIAAKVISLAEQSQTPVMSHFCELRRGQKLRFGNDSKEEQSLVGLVYSLIRQLVELLPPVFEASSDLSAEKFNSLDGTIQCWHAALATLTDLAGLMPGPVFCIIDGLHWLNDRSTDNCLSEFVRVLRGGPLKMLLSTTGRSVVLRTEITRSETLYVSNMKTLQRGVALDRHNLSDQC
ncbi:hypothetical protein LY76DRAFT_556540 [Colletotrichum caudatum]|nr:hypothetical protein LY76DRAFT_556540 [Colletotrichum caudatum]